MRILQALLVLVILGLQVRLWVGPGSLTEINHLEDAIAEQEGENTLLEDRNQNLLQEVESLKTGTDAIEEMARQELGLIKEGETFYMIIDTDDTDKGAANQAETETQGAEHE